ncbi:hypothetical protein NDU88_002745 [Pleurodeles waltl]|uniref:Uncharacterized protein n=1 Tax=Pleurodeles waltl TaxID=8319 RepID=A0AAV7T496_PLEWA|nr:hypothetical protein NDU88_002745 [Pleurodeles waltl]
MATGHHGLSGAIREVHLPNEAHTQIHKGHDMEKISPVNVMNQFLCIKEKCQKFKGIVLRLPEQMGQKVEMVSGTVTRDKTHLGLIDQERYGFAKVCSQFLGQNLHVDISGGRPKGPCVMEFTQEPVLPGKFTRRRATMALATSLSVIDCPVDASWPSADTTRKCKGARKASIYSRWPLDPK